VQHTIWRSAAPIAMRSSRPSAGSRAVHRRRPSSRGERGARARRDARERREGHSLGDGADASTMLAVAFPHDQVQILPYNRT
jgi:hypothetical protein